MDRGWKKGGPEGVWHRCWARTVVSGCGVMMCYVGMYGFGWIGCGGGGLFGFGYGGSGSGEVVRIDGVDSWCVIWVLG